MSSEQQTPDGSLQQPPVAVLFVIAVTFPISVPLLALLNINFHKLSWRIRENSCIRTFYDAWRWILVKLGFKTVEEVSA